MKKKSFLNKGGIRMHIAEAETEENADSTEKETDSESK